MFHPVRALLAPAGFSACYTRVVALAVLFLALTLLAVAALALVPQRSSFQPHAFTRLGQRVVVVVVVGATEAGAVISAHLSRGKALAVHLETLGLFACAARFLLFNGRGGGDGVALGRFHLLGQRYLVVIVLEGGGGDVLVEADGGGGWEVAVGLNEEESVG